MTADSPAPAERTLFGHPIALYVLFMTELWERMSFYGMRALLILFMTAQIAEGGFGWGDGKAAIIYGAYGALVYATPIAGGALADKILGYRNAIVLGGLVMTLGHLTLGLEPFFGEDNAELVFYAALAMLVIGNGFFKPNISSLVGKLYPEGDPRRDGAFTIFYMGINLGAMAAPLVCGTLGELYGWHYGFGAAGIGMALGLVGFLASQQYLDHHGLAPGQDDGSDARPTFARTPVLATWAGAFIAIPLFVFIIRANELFGPAVAAMGGPADVLGTALTVIGLAILAYLLFVAWQAGPVDGQRLGVVIVLLFFSMTFWAFFEQAGSSINLFTDRNVDRSVFGWEMPTSWGQAINPLFIVVLAPAFSTLWQRLASADRDPSAPTKFGLGLLQLGLGFLVLWSSQFFATPEGMVPLVFLLAGYLLHTTGELCLSPVGLSMVTKLSPGKIVGFVMGAWFLATAFSHYIAGAIAAMTGGGGHGGHGAAEAAVSGMASLHSYTDVFGTIGGVAIAISVVCFAMSWTFLTRWMHGVK